jgi:hypothetical protein
MREIPLVGTPERYRLRVTLGGVVLVLGMEYRRRAAAWYVSTSTSSGELVSVSRLSPGAVVWPDVTDPRLPGGALVVTGPDPYRAEQLGTDVLVAYLEADELEAVGGA